MRPTIKDVAKLANVSTATVSLVINNNTRITSETKKKVLKAIKDLDYHPSGSARGLVSKKTGNIGFILTDDHFLVTEPFYTKIFLGAEFEAHKNEYYILLTTVKKNFTVSDPLPRFVLERTVDAIIIAGEVPQTLVNAVSEYDIPITFIDYDPPYGNFSVITNDNIKGGMIATNHLLEYGHKNIGFIGGNIVHSSIKDRLYGYKTALENSGITIKPEYIITDESETDRKSGYLSTEKLLNNNSQISAIFACNDAMAIGAMQFMKENNIQIPNHISLIGFDDIEGDLMLDPPLTTVRIPKLELGSSAVKLVVDVIKNKEVLKSKVLVPVELIVRESTKKC